MNASLFPAPQSLGRPLDKPQARKQPWAITTQAGQITIRPLSVTIAQERISAPIAINAVVGGADVTLQLQEETLELLCKRLEEGLEWQTLEKSAKPLVLEYLFEDFLETLESVIGVGITIKDITSNAVESFAPNFGFEVKHGDIVIPTCGAFSIIHLRALTAWQSRLPAANFRLLAASVSFRKGTAVISGADLKSLRCGDAIVLDVSETSRLWAVTEERFLAELAEDDNGLRLIGPLLARPPKAMEQLMSDNPDGDHKNTPLPGSVGDIPIRLSFDVGRIEIPLAELEKIGEGHVFRIERPSSESVEIIAQGRIIGRGEIVNVDGLTAVRVTALND